MQHMKVYNGGTFLQLHLMHSVKIKYFKDVQWADLPH